jgi:hypothetical protein
MSQLDGSDIFMEKVQKCNGLEFIVRWFCRVIFTHRNGRKATSPQLAAKEVLK